MVVAIITASWAAAVSPVGLKVEMTKAAARIRNAPSPSRALSVRSESRYIPTCFQENGGRVGRGGGGGGGIARVAGAGAIGRAAMRPVPAGRLAPLDCPDGSGASIRGVGAGRAGITGGAGTAVLTEAA